VAVRSVDTRRGKRRPSPDPSAEPFSPAAARRLQQTYGIDEQEYQRLLALQSGRCAICGCVQRYQRLSVDHCHSSGRVRGLLCVQCNRGLGRFFDSADRLRRAVAYLESAGCCPVHTAAVSRAGL
jgi:hypothetical protein